ncbi:hypothetical protein BCON_0091g00280 [Botryotinia convoluta]|uniref:Uncharacterized protein n=1 Tax=Botryotinia convoluta TaxID=54673 RepID=A0A4Z1I7V3_9HELO|nr:hypothetical protein BCON_0091g00280 [Botryotinia convoluta]
MVVSQAAYNLALYNLWTPMQGVENIQLRSLQNASLKGRCHLENQFRMQDNQRDILVEVHCYLQYPDNQIRIRWLMGILRQTASAFALDLEPDLNPRVNLINSITTLKSATFTNKRKQSPQNSMPMEEK